MKELQEKIFNYNIKTINTCEQLLKNLIYYDNYFSITLSEQTGNIEAFATKLWEKATNFEIINEKNERLGIISFYANDFITNIAFITLIVVDKKNTNKGIGSILIEFAEKYCKDKGMKEMKLEVLKNNDNALRFYKKHNYSICKEREDTYYMSKKI